MGGGTAGSGERSARAKGGGGGAGDEDGPRKHIGDREAAAARAAAAAAAHKLINGIRYAVRRALINGLVCVSAILKTILPLACRYESKTIEQTGPVFGKHLSVPLPLIFLFLLLLHLRFLLLLSVLHLRLPSDTNFSICSGADKAVRRLYTRDSRFSTRSLGAHF